jgi:hypothetical protein
LEIEFDFSLLGIDRCDLIEGMSVSFDRNGTAANGSATAFNMLASTGGLGFGMSTGIATGVLDSRSIYGVQSDSAATGTFNGNGFGKYGNTPSQPYTGGFVNGNGGGGGTAVVNGAVTGDFTYYGDYVDTNGDAAFKSNGGGSGFVKGKNGGADGSATGGASGKAAGIATDDVSDQTYRDLDFSVISAANGAGAPPTCQVRKRRTYRHFSWLCADLEESFVLRPILTTSSPLSTLDTTKA